MSAAGELFAKFGGHKAAGGFSFPLENEEKIREALIKYAADIKEKNREFQSPAAENPGAGRFSVAPAGCGIQFTSQAD